MSVLSECFRLIGLLALLMAAVVLPVERCNALPTTKLVDESSTMAINSVKIPATIFGGEVAEFEIIPAKPDLPPSSSGGRVREIFQFMQSALDRVEPWAVRVEESTKQFEENAKRLSKTVISSVSSFVEKLFQLGIAESGLVNNGRSTTTTSTTTEQSPSTEDAFDVIKNSEAVDSSMTAAPKTEVEIISVTEDKTHHPLDDPINTMDNEI